MIKLKKDLEKDLGQPSLSHENHNLKHEIEITP